MRHKTAINELFFEERDIQIFNVPDIKTKLSTLQNYFFPRLEILLRHTLSIVQEVYDLNPYERMTFVYCPNHRKKAVGNKDRDLVHIGVAAKRGIQSLKILRKNGKPFHFHPTYLTFKVLPTGLMYVELLPFRQLVDDSYVSSIASLVQQHSDTLAPLLSFAHIAHTSELSYCDFLPLHKAIVPQEIGTLGIKLISPKYYFPINISRVLNELIISFIILYALAESFICIGEGQEPMLSQMLKRFKDWYINLEVINTEIEEQTKNELSEMPELDSYSFIRSGRWWTVLARDKWKCLSCGRSAREDGIILEVDHIVPRSKGGTDDVTNLQTLCKKCNVGKSNRDSTRL